MGQLMNKVKDLWFKDFKICFRGEGRKIRKGYLDVKKLL